MVVDGLSATALFIAVSMLRLGPDEWRNQWATAGIDAGFAAVLFGVAWTATLWFNGLYRLRSRWSVRREILDVLTATTILAVAVFTVLFLFKFPNVSRLVLILLFPLQAALTIASRALIRQLFIMARSRGQNYRFLLIVGANRAGESFANRIDRNPQLGIRVVGHLASQQDVETKAADTVSRPVIGTIDDIETVLHEGVIDEVAICLPLGAWQLVEPITRLCEEEGRVVRIPVPEPGLVLPGGRVEEFDGIRILSLSYGPDRTVGLVAKRLLDIGFALAGLVLTSPIVLGAALIIVLREGRPILFRQVRVGLHGRPFEIYKLRSMVPDAEEQYEAVASLSDTRGPAFKMVDDPRVTRLGQALRRTSIDELPQLWNVLRGDMSIVGPRPAPPREVAEYDIWHRRRLSMKPGITGLWQVEARFDEEFDHRALLDLAYIDRWSIWLDLKIIARTIPAVVANPGR